MLWACKKLANFWISIFDIISDITSIHTQVSLSLALLNLGIDTVPHHTGTVVINILLGARLMIMRHWRSPLYPSLSEVITTVHLHYTYESMFAFANGS